MEVVYEGIRLTPDEIVQSARDEGVHVIGLSILSGSHSVLVTDVLQGLADENLKSLPVIVGGIIPEDDAEKLRSAGVKSVYTPKDYDLTRIVDEIVDTVAESHAAGGSRQPAGRRRACRGFGRAQPGGRLPARATSRSPAATRSAGGPRR